MPGYANNRLKKTNRGQIICTGALLLTMASCKSGQRSKVQEIGTNTATEATYVGADASLAKVTLAVDPTNPFAKVLTYTLLKQDVASADAPIPQRPAPAYVRHVAWTNSLDARSVFVFDALAPRSQQDSAIPYGGGAVTRDSGDAQLQALIDAQASLMEVTELLASGKSEAELQAANINLEEIRRAELNAIQISDEERRAATLAAAKSDIEARRQEAIATARDNVSILKAEVSTLTNTLTSAAADARTELARRSTIASDGESRTGSADAGEQVEDAEDKSKGSNTAPTERAKGR